jgi:hypothetical protein
MDKTSPIDSTISNLGLWSIESVTDKFKLLFFGRLCRSNSSTTHKKLFHILISQIILEEDEIENTITYDLIKTLVKYDMFSFLETFVHETFIPKKDLWSKIVRQSISISEENRWHDIIKCNKISLELTQHNGQVAFFIAIEPSLTNTSSSRLIFGHTSVRRISLCSLAPSIKISYKNFLQIYGRL